MGANLSTPEKLHKLARTGDTSNLQALLSDLQRNDSGFRTNRGRYLEAQDDNGNTPLTAAAARGHLGCVKLLLQFGANLHHVNQKPDGGSALHEAVAHRHEAVVEALLAHGANPFIENAKGFTAMDIACSTRNVPLLRRLEHCAPFTGWLLMKVPQFGGLGSSWQRRWVVVSHRYPYPHVPPQRQLTHCVFLAFKTLANTAPSCRVWLDGARAREVYSPKAEARLQFNSAPDAARVAQAGVTLHRKHEQPSGVYTTGGHAGPGGQVAEGCTLYLRPEDGSQRSIDALDKLIRTINNRGFPPAAPTPPAGGSGAAQPPGVGPLYTSMLAGGASAATPSQPAMATTPGSWGAALSLPPAVDGTESDEQIARRLQEEYDAEVAQQMQQQGSPAAARPQSAPVAPSAPSSSLPSASSHSGTAPLASGGSGGPDYLTGGGFYPAVYPPQQPGSAPAPGAGRQQSLLQPSGSAPPQLAAAMAAAAAGRPSASAPGSPGAPLAAGQSFGRPSAPSLLDSDYPPPAIGMVPGPLQSQLPPLQYHQLPGSVSAPRLEGAGWYNAQPAAPPSRPHSEPAGFDAAAASAAVLSAPAGLAGSASGNKTGDDSDICVVCLDASATAGVLHGDSVHKCLCKDCAAMLKADKIDSCPMCREPIDAYIMRVF